MATSYNLTVNCAQSRHRHWLVWAWLMVMIPVVFTGNGADEYDVKAAFLYNFTKFIEWPPGSNFAGFTICVLGEDPFGANIDRLVKGKAVAARPIQIRRIEDPAEGKECQLVFVTSLEKSKESRLIEAVSGAPVVTVGESRDFLRKGGMIVLTMEENVVNIVINPSAAENVRLKISAKLLTLVKIFKSDEGGAR